MRSALRRLAPTSSRLFFTFSENTQSWGNISNASPNIESHEGGWFERGRSQEIIVASWQLGTRTDSNCRVVLAAAQGCACSTIIDINSTAKSSAANGWMSLQEKVSLAVRVVGVTRRSPPQFFLTGQKVEPFDFLLRITRFWLINGFIFWTQLSNKQNKIC